MERPACTVEQLCRYIKEDNMTAVAEVVKAYSTAAYDYACKVTDNLPEKDEIFREQLRHNMIVSRSRQDIEFVVERRDFNGEVGSCNIVIRLNTILPTGEKKFLMSYEGHYAYVTILNPWEDYVDSLYKNHHIHRDCDKVVSDKIANFAVGLRELPYTSEEIQAAIDQKDYSKLETIVRETAAAVYEYVNSLTDGVLEEDSNLQDDFAESCIFSKDYDVIVKVTEDSGRFNLTVHKPISECRKRVLVDTSEWYNGYNWTRSKDGWLKLVKDVLTKYSERLMIGIETTPELIAHIKESSQKSIKSLKGQAIKYNEALDRLRVAGVAP